VRKIFWLASLGAGLYLAAPAWAQRPSVFGSVNSADLKNVPINISSATLNAPLPPTPSAGFSLRKFMPHLSLMNFSSAPRIGTSPLPPASSFPSTHYKSPLKPVAPIIPKS